MLILRRQEGQSVDVTDREGNTIRIVVLPRRRGDHPCDIHLGFHDRQHNFRIERPDRRRPEPTEGHVINVAGSTAFITPIQEPASGHDRKNWDIPPVSTPMLVSTLDLIYPPQPRHVHE